MTPHQTLATALVSAFLLLTACNDPQESCFLEACYDGLFVDVTAKDGAVVTTFEGTADVNGTIVELLCEHGRGSSETWECTNEGVWFPQSPATMTRRQGVGSRIVIFFRKPSWRFLSIRSHG